MKASTLATILAARASGRTPVWVAPTEGAVPEMVLFPMETARPDGPIPLVTAHTAALQAADEDRAVLFESDGVQFLARAFNPPARLVVVGAVHVAQTLVPMAAQAGFAVHVVDPRPHWVSEFRFPNVERLRAWPDEAFATLELDHRTAVVTLTHDPKVDDPALRAALASPCFYVGALGSRRTHAKRVERLREAGADAAALDRIHSPVGLDIGARGPAEIAVSILAEVVQTLRTPAE